MKNRYLQLFSTAGILIIVITSVTFTLRKKAYTQMPTTESIAVKPINSVISADGVVSSQNQATLNFQISGKLIYLPYKEGDIVQQGQTIAQLDTYLLQRQLTAALNTYRSTRATFDQTKDNSNNSILQGQQKYQLETLNRTTVSGDLENNIVNDIAKRIVDENQSNLDNSVINVELANYALQLASLTSPITGIITHEDVTVPFINITPSTSFTIADPNNIVFKANVSENDIDFVSVGSQATIRVDGIQQKLFQGIVIKLYPSKITLTSGERVYQVDIQSDELKSIAKLEQSGTVLITNNTGGNVTLIPAWTVVSHQYVWVMGKGIAKMKKVQIGKIHGSDIEILNGLNPSDKVIINPESIAAKNYQLL